MWRWDYFYDTTIGRPAQEIAAFGADVVEPKILDGAVTGVAVTTRRSGEGLRKVQSGFVRQYALVLVAGMAVLVVFLTSRSW